MNKARKYALFASLAISLGSAPAQAGLELSVEIRSQVDKTLQSVKMVSLKVGTAVNQCQVRGEASTFLCQGSLLLGADDELALEVEPVDAARSLPRRIPLDPAEWQARTRPALTIFLSGPVGAVSYSTIDTARRYIESPSPQPDRALALLESINERLFVQPTSIAILNRGLFLFNYGRALQNLCLDRNLRYATCDAAVTALRNAEDLQRQNPSTLSIEAAGYSPALVNKAISDIETDRMQREEAKRSRAYQDAAADFRRRNYCGAAEKFAALIENYEHAPDEARYLRNSGAFYFFLSYQLALAHLNCGMARITLANLAEGCESLRNGVEEFAEVLPRADSEAIPAGQEVLWRSHRTRIEADLPEAMESARLARAKYCAGR